MKRKSIEQVKKGELVMLNGKKFGQNIVERNMSI
jgi:hypothetical protein